MFSRCVKSTSRSIQRVLALASRAPQAYSFSSAQGSGDQGGPKLNLNLKGIKKELSKPVYFDESVNQKHYDVAIIGGGSAGLGFVLEAQKIGLKVVMFDYVDPSPRGTKWGLGGTCVNVGCIPKKLMHHAANTKEIIVDSYDYGFNLGEFNDPDDHTYTKLHESLEWSRLVRNVQMNVKRTNFTYIADVKEYDNTTYVNGMAAFHDKNTLVYTSQKSALEDYLKTDKVNTEKMGTVTADHIIVAVGGRPTYLNEKVCKGVHEHAITSDDIFSLKNPPNKTLVVGGGYIALECAGFLSTLGYPVTLMNRTDVFLRGFDQDMATTVIDFMKRNSEINVLPWTLPYEISKENGKLVTKFKNLQNSTEGRDEFDTILLAIGRTPNTANLNLRKVGVEVNPKSHKIVGGFQGEFEKTSVNNIWALGDVLDKIPELTPVASKSAHNLARRLQYAKDGKAGTPEYKRYLMDYRDFPTAVFTPLEYACVGFSEEKAIEIYGEENIQVYHTKFTPLDQTLLMRNHPVDGESMKMKGYAKVVCNKKDDERVVGLHYAGPNAGEVIQGYAVAVKLGMTKHDLERTVAIHPTTSEEIVLMEKTKAEDPEKTSCCA